jgi:hypothetical protein
VIETAPLAGGIRTQTDRGLDGLQFEIEHLLFFRLPGRDLRNSVSVTHGTRGEIAPKAGSQLLERERGHN